MTQIDNNNDGLSFWQLLKTIETVWVRIKLTASVVACGGKEEAHTE